MVRKKIKRGSRVKYEDCKDVIEEVVKMKVKRGVFAYFDYEDAAQEIRIMCIKALKDYKPSIGPLKNYLIRCVQNRQYNLKRDVYFKYNPPCKKCRRYLKKDRDCSGNRESCEKWIRHSKEMESQINIMNPIDISVVRGHQSSLLEFDSMEEIYADDLADLIRKNLPPNLVSHYDNMLAMGKVPKRITEEIRVLAQEILANVR